MLGTTPELRERVGAAPPRPQRRWRRWWGSWRPPARDPASRPRADSPSAPAPGEVQGDQAGSRWRPGAAVEQEGGADQRRGRRPGEDQLGSTTPGWRDDRAGTRGLLLPHQATLGGEDDPPGPGSEHELDGGEHVLQGRRRTVPERRSHRGPWEEAPRTKPRRRGTPPGRLQAGHWRRSLPRSAGAAGLGPARGGAGAGQGGGAGEPLTLGQLQNGCLHVAIAGDKERGGQDWCATAAPGRLIPHPTGVSLLERWSV